ncbi:hypothetical protein [Mesorhizobium sp. M7A.F.Ca.US.006.01.1.1]|nr:hypothetical protein [Mesorhizobium sp. M7A.F.Ca.US.006.01.1.1]
MFDIVEILCRFRGLVHLAALLSAVNDIQVAVDLGRIQAVE